MANEKSSENMLTYLKTGYVLVVDDMVNMRRTIKNMVRQLGVGNVLEADDGDTALHIMRKNPDCRFVLMDWNMPRMTGIDAAHEIRADAQMQDVPILLITAEVNREQVALAGELGVNGYIIKPFVTNTLEEKLYGVLNARANPPEHVKLGKIGEGLFRQALYQKALFIFEMAKNAVENARVWVNIGETHEMLGDPEKAHASYASAVQLNPLYLKAHVKSAELHLKEGNKDAALESLQKAAAISPRNPDRHIIMGKIHMENGDMVQATAAFGEAVKGEAAKSAEIAEELLKAGKAEMAEHYFRASLGKSADDIHVYNRLGISLRRQGKWEEAILEYNTALKVDPRDEGLYFNMAKAYIEGKQLKLAEVNFKKALELNPNLEAARRELEAIKKGLVPA